MNGNDANSNDKAVRVRFAPSPSGFLHIGGARTALFNYLFAKKRGGKFIVRVDDTDLSRSSDDSIKSILADLKWLGLDWDHGLDAVTLKDMDTDGPYRASARKDIYMKYAMALVTANLAYHSTDTDDNGNTTTAIKFKVPKDKDIFFYDDIRGKVSTPAGSVDDFVLIRSNGMATYNFATVVDDHLMGITHVYRADEHIPNTFKQIVVFNAFGWDVPKFGHMSLILGPDKAKLSKRHGAASIDDFRNKGYTKDALINYIAMLGWGHPKGKDIFPMNDLIDVFSIKKVNVSPAMFDVNKLNYINSHYLKAMPRNDLVNFVDDILRKNDINATTDFISKAIGAFTGWAIASDIVKDFTNITTSDISDDAVAFLKDSPHVKSVIDSALTNDLDLDKVHLDVPTKDLKWTLRILLYGTPHGPATDLLIPIVSKDVISKRVDKIKDLLK